MADRTRIAMGGSKKKSKGKSKKSKKFKAMHIRRMTGDGNSQFSITHDQHPGEDGATPEAEEHGAEDEQSLLQHVAQHAPNIGAAPAPEPMPGL